jgi:hypothetical protein
MRDFVDRDCQVGDVIVFNEPRYRNLVRGTIVKFTPKGVRAVYQIGNRPGDLYKRDTFVYEGEFVKIEGGKHD